jgi:teichoic acid transport system ATP-binding protein
MKSRLAFSIAMQINPDILLVDEILSVGDKAFKEKSFQTFTSFKNKNKTIVIVTHSLGKLSFCDRVLLLHKGKIVMIGSPNEVIKKYNDITISKNNNSKNQEK